MAAQTMREAIEGAFDESESEPKSEAEQTEEDGGTEETGGSDKDTEESVGTTDEEAPKGDVEESDGDKEEPELESKDDKPEVSEDTAESAVKPPASWKPGAREHWGKVPVEAQREIARREKHMDHMVRESADSRKHQNEFNELMRPFEPLMAAQNATPFASIKSLMTTAAGLTLGTPVQKAQVIANIMKQYNVGVADLDNILVGQPAQPGVADNSGVAAIIQNELAPFRQFMGQMNTQREEYASNQTISIESDIEKFANDPAHEFFDDVKDDMADLMDMASGRNQTMSLDQAYEKACRIDVDISNILTKRSGAAASVERKEELRKKRDAASSVHAHAVGDGTKGSDTLRGAITDAWDDQA